MAPRRPRYEDFWGTFDAGSMGAEQKKTASMFMGYGVPDAYNYVLSYWTDEVLSAAPRRSKLLDAPTHLLHIKTYQNVAAQLAAAITRLYALTTPTMDTLLGRNAVERTDTTSHPKWAVSRDILKLVKQLGDATSTIPFNSNAHLRNRSQETSPYTQEDKFAISCWEAALAILAQQYLLLFEWKLQRRDNAYRLTQDNAILDWLWEFVSHTSQIDVCRISTTSSNFSVRLTLVDGHPDTLRATHPDAVFFVARDYLDRDRQTHNRTLIATNPLSTDVKNLQLA